MHFLHLQHQSCSSIPVYNNIKVTLGVKILMLSPFQYIQDKMHSLNIFPFTNWYLSNNFITSSAPCLTPASSFSSSEHLKSFIPLKKFMRLFISCNDLRRNLSVELSAPQDNILGNTHSSLLGINQFFNSHRWSQRHPNHQNWNSSSNFHRAGKKNVLIVLV